MVRILVHLVIFAAFIAVLNIVLSLPAFAFLDPYRVAVIAIVAFIGLIILLQNLGVISGENTRLR